MKSLGLSSEELKHRKAERERNYRRTHPERMRELERARHRRDGVKRRARDKVWRNENKQLAYDISHRTAAKVDAIKTAKPCMDCGVKFPAECMDFDHRPNEQKIDNVSHLVVCRMSWSSIEEEIAKCDLICANCHRTRTKKRFDLARLGKGA